MVDELCPVSRKRVDVLIRQLKKVMRDTGERLYVRLPSGAMRGQVFDVRRCGGQIQVLRPGSSGGRKGRRWRNLGAMNLCDANGNDQ